LITEMICSGHSCSRSKWNLQVILLCLLLVNFCSGCTRDITTNPESGEEEDITSRFWEEYFSPFIFDVSSMDADDQGNLFLAGSIYNTGRVFGSDNWGQSWFSCEIPASSDPQQIRMDRSGNLFVVSRGNEEDRCLYHLPPGDTDWQKIEIEVYSVQFDSRNRCFYNTWDGLYVTSDLFNTREKVLDERGIELIEISPNDEILVMADSIMFRSNDSGETWSEFEVPAGGRISHLGLETDSEGYIYILIWDYEKDETVLLSTSEGGESWNEILHGPGTSWANLLVTPGNTVLCFMSRHLLRSLDRGESWVYLATGYFYGSIHSNFEELFGRGGVILSAAAEEAIFVGDDRGVYRSGDNGESWDLVGIPRYTYSDILIDSENWLWFSCHRGGVYIAEPGSGVFSHVNKGLIYPENLCLAGNGMGDMLAGTGSGVFRISTENSGWVRVGLDSMLVRGLYSFDDGSFGAFVTPRDYGWTGGLYKSEDGGNSWSYLGMCGYHILCAEADSKGVVYVGTLHGGAFRYTGEGKVWEQLSGGLASGRVYDLEADPAGAIYAAMDGGIYRFNEADTVWASSLRTGETAAELLKGEGGNLYAVTQQHIYRKSVNRSEWKVINSNPYNISLGDRKMDIDRDGYIYLALESGLYRTADRY